MDAGRKPISLADALNEVIQKRGINRMQGDRQLHETWRAVAGEQIASNTKVGEVRGGSLHILVGNSPLLGELVSFHQKSLLKAMQTALPNMKLRSLKFRLNSSVGK